VEWKWKKRSPHSLFRNIQKFSGQFPKCSISDIITKHSHHPRILFKPINSIVNPQDSPAIEASIFICEEFLKLLEKKDHIKAQFDPVVSDTQPHFPIDITTFDQFQAVSYTELWDIVKHMKLSTTPYDPIPSQIIKDAFDAVGPSI